MPLLINKMVMDGLKKVPAALEHVNYHYKYPFGKNLKPGTPLHDDLRARLMERARASRSIIQERFDSWRDIDRMCTVYVTPDEEERMVQEKDPRKPVSIVIPVMYSVRETLLTYMVSAFLNDPIFRYRGTGPEDSIGAMLMEMSIYNQCLHNKVGLSMYLMWQDAFQYGTGYGVVGWRTEYGKRRRKVTRQTEPSLDDLMNGRQGTSFETTETNYEPIYEGMTFDTIDPYLAFPDPNVRSFDIQNGEFFGWMEKTNRMNKLSDEREQNAENFFNAKYLKHIDGRSIFCMENLSDRLDTSQSSRIRDGLTAPVDDMHMFIKLIPEEWGIGKKTYPELWVFTLSGDSVITRAEPMDLNHGRIPVVATSPDTDGYSASPMSRLEVVYPSQHYINWLYSARMTNIRKTINGITVVDPGRINMKSMLEPGPGKIIRLRESMWGRGKVSDAIMQMPVNDVTQGHIRDAHDMMNLINTAAGTTDATQGVARQSGERVSAEEASNTHFGSMSKFQKIAYLISTMAHQDIAYMGAAHTQQFTEISSYMELSTGSWDDVLLDTYTERLEQGQDGRMYTFTTPEDLQINYDIVGHDGAIPTTGSLKDMVPLYQMALGSPELSQSLSMTRLFLRMAQMAGFKNVQDFLRRGGGQTESRVLPNEQIQNQVQQGNLKPLGG